MYEWCLNLDWMYAAACFAIGCIYYLMHWTRCGALYTCTYRARMRKEYNLAGDNCTDCFTSCFCEYCVICQQYRELKNRGFDLSAGIPTYILISLFLSSLVALEIWGRKCRKCKVRRLKTEIKKSKTCG